MKQLILLLLCSFSLFAAGTSNRFAIDSTVFDPDHFTIKMSWSFDTSGIPGPLQGGISVKLGKTPDSIPDFLVFFETPLKDTTFLIPELHFDTTYSLQIWMKNENGWIAPDSHAIRTISIESSSRQPVDFFDPGKKIDTIAILKKSVFLWKDSNYALNIPPHIDTVVSYTPDQSNLHGLTLAGPGFRFLHPEPTVPFYIGFKIDTNKFSGSRTRIFTDSSGFYRAQKTSFYDTLHSIIYTATNSMKLPFVVLTDTIRPKIQVISDTSSIIDVDATIDTILVHDNCPGVRWNFFCLSDDDSSNVHPVSNGIIPDTSGLIICKFPFLEFSRNGARAFLTITDGTYLDTIDLSRRSIRTTGDIISTKGNFIMPVFTTVDIDSPGIHAALKTLFQLSGGTYNKSIFRLYRWGQPSNTTTTSNWIESSAANEPLFQFKPSGLFWLITKQSVLFELGKGKTPSVKGDFIVTLSPKNWTDFSVPYSFNTHLSDVIKHTGAAASDIQYYRWVKNDSARSYSANLMFSKSVNADSCSKVAFSSETDGYTAYNPFDTAIQLHFPVYTFDQTTPVTILTKQSAETPYAIAVKGVASNGSATTVFCTTHQGNDTLLCPQPPSFSSPCVSILQGEGGQQASIVSYPSNNSVSFYKLFLPKTNGNSVTLSAEIRNSAQLLQYCFLRKTQAGFAILSNTTVSLNPQNESNIYVAVAEKATMEHLFPNVKSQFTEPGPASFKFDKNRIIFTFKRSSENVIVELFNLQGQRVLNFTATPLNPSIEFILTSGVYIAKLSTIVENSTESFVQYQKISFGRQELFHAK
jgi:hypothetical protein